MVGDIDVVKEYVDFVYVQIGYVGMFDCGENVFLVWVGGEQCGFDQW